MGQFHNGSYHSSSEAGYDEDREDSGSSGNDGGVSHIEGGPINGINTGPAGDNSRFGIIAITIFALGIVGSIIYAILK